MDFDVNGVNELPSTPTSPAVGHLAGLLLRQQQESGAPLLDGKVVSYSTATGLAVVTVRGVAVPDVPNVSGLMLWTNDVVLLADYGPSYTIVGSSTATLRNASLPSGAALNFAGGWSTAAPGPTSGTSFTCKAGVLRGTASCTGYSTSAAVAITVQLYIDGINQGDMGLSPALTANAHHALSTVGFAQAVAAGMHYVYFRQTSGVSDTSDFGALSAVVTPT